MKKLICSALALLMLATAVVAVIPPVTADAAYCSTASLTAETKNLDQIKTLVNATMKEAYMDPEDALQAEMAEGYIVSFTNGGYTVYVNRYTGRMYYQNNTTGQMLTSNPTDMRKTNSSAYYETSTAESVLSQVSVSFTELVGNKGYNYGSFAQSARYGQLTVSQIDGGLRVHYTLGDTTSRYLYPGRVSYSTFMRDILQPMLDQFSALLFDNFTDYFTDDQLEEFADFFDGGSWQNPNVSDSKKAKTPMMSGGYINTQNIATFLDYFVMPSKPGAYYYKIKGNENFKQLQDLGKAIIQMLTNAYSLENPNEYLKNENILKKMQEDYPITAKINSSTGEYEVIFVQKSGVADATKRMYAGYIKKYCPDFTYQMMDTEEKYCGYVRENSKIPIVRLALEYRLDDDGSLQVTVPANSISFDATSYVIQSIDILPFFGTGTMTYRVEETVIEEEQEKIVYNEITDSDGYVFYPDGSGTIVKFGDFFNANQKAAINLSASVYGQDYTYANVTGAHREQVTMPVFGVSNTVMATTTTANAYGVTHVENGYFAILEEGASLATLRLQSGGLEHRYMNVHPAYTPFPTDTVSLSETISSGSTGDYTMTGDIRYGGNYVIRYSMLTDPTVAAVENAKPATEKAPGVSYCSNYNDMAKLYRDYLKADGTLTVLETVSENLPLYLEVIGAMEIDDTFLTFPVRKKIALTTFDDVLTMYGDFDELGISNLNFKLTGFANGGVESTYPVKSKFEKVVGGNKGFTSLLNSAAEISAQEGKNLGIYPEYEFLYIENKTLFDGVGYHNNVAKMLDNRYANKRLYDSVSQTYTTGNGYVIAAEALDKLYSRFEKKYSKFSATGLSVSSMGSDINSNFDEDNTVDRETERANVTSVLARMSEKYDLMVDVGNVYAVKYATHVLNAATDSSHFRYSSYSIPFVGMILHGYVSYSGAPLNNSGSPDYEILRDIECGATLTYTLTYRNNTYMKEESATNNYYSVDYKNWFDSIVASYTELNNAIGDLQNSEIVAHRILMGERVVGEDETKIFYRQLADEFIAFTDAQIATQIDDKYDAILAEGAISDKYHLVNLKVTVDTVKLLEQYEAAMHFERYDENGNIFVLDPAFIAEIRQDVTAGLGNIKTKYETMYDGTGPNTDDYELVFDTVDMTETQYHFITTSDATAKDYVSTVYSCENGNIVLVTYRDMKTGKETSFILNYNIFTVVVNLNGTYYSLDKYSYIKLTGEAKA